jgi:hypothetical protein
MAQAVWAMHEDFLLRAVPNKRTMPTTTKSGPADFGPADVQLAVLSVDIDMTTASLLCDFETALGLECGKVVVFSVCLDKVLVIRRDLIDLLRRVV